MHWLQDYVRSVFQTGRSLVCFDLFENHKIIHLVQNNYPKAVISRGNMFKNEVAHIVKTVRAKRFCLEFNSIVRRLRVIDYHRKAFSVLISIIFNDVIEVSHDALRQNESEALKGLLNFLEVLPKIDLLSSERVELFSGSYG